MTCRNRRVAAELAAGGAIGSAVKSEIQAPFKMQGVADIIDNALLVRFKFTARPGNPAMIQRAAVKRMFKVFPTLGIEFAKEGATVILRTPAASAEGSAADAASVTTAGKEVTAPVAAARGLMLSEAETDGIVALVLVRPETLCLRANAWSVIR